ncbi:hypothetical protein [Pseudomonas sp. Marseille-P9899]|uniref:hypothetical protein n=1 Tax=Pseudomonas sp. Marseille-P9899 TaxID=2730401 RepID=UPI001588602A|nr:hypothetical protein [Pseudomonas sp. Marseille-P9899]
MLNHDADDLLPSMVGFEQDSVGAGEHRWRSQGYLLADRDLSLGERIHAWVIRERDGQVMKTVAFTADKDNRLVAKWPAAFLSAINSAPVSSGESRYLTAGKFSDNGALEVSATGSPSSKLFSDMTFVKKAEVNRLWYYDSGYRVFTSAPFIANQVIAAQVPGFDLAAGEQLSLQVRDRTSLHLYETFLFTPAGDVRKAAAWPEALCKYIDETNKKSASAYGMLRAGKQGDDKVSISPAKTGNALWIPQYSNLSVELEPVTWQKYKAVGAFKPTDGAVIQFLVYDRYSNAQLPGSPFSHTVKGSDAAACMTSLASALKASPLGSYLRLGGATADAEPAAASSNLWIMGLPVRVVTLGLPDITSLHEKALENPDGTPLALGELFDKYKDGVRITLCDRWSGQVAHAWAFEPGVADKATKDAWVRALCIFLCSKFATDVPFVGFGEKVAQSSAPATTDKKVDAWTLWAPAEAEMVLHAEPWAARVKKEISEPTQLGTRLMFLRDKLVSEEVLIMGAIPGLTGTAEKARYLLQHHFYRLRAWHGKEDVLINGEVIEGLGAMPLVNEVLGIAPGPKAGISAQHDDDKRRDLLSAIWSNSVSSEIYAKAGLRSALVDQDISALPASRVSREDIPFSDVELWQLRLPPNYWVKECLACSEDRMTLTVIDTKSLDSRPPTRHEPQRTVPDGLVFYPVSVVGDLVVTDPVNVTAKIEEARAAQDRSENRIWIEKLRKLIPGSDLPSVTLDLQLLPGVAELGIRFVSYTPELMPGTAATQVFPLEEHYRRSAGIHLHIPDGMTITTNHPLARASYISEAGITRAAASVLTIDPPITGRPFIPSDSLCADYANTLGSEVYDVSGATENGVDPRTGLFHAHYPVGVIRGLDGTGPNIDLTLHYSATRANESALGDGWAFRFSSYDNRLRRLTLGTGQTLTLTAANITEATDKKRLPINGVTLTGAKGTFDKLTHLTVIFPSGRQEVLAEPGTHDKKEASEHYKMAYLEKLEGVQKNLKQWLKESGVSSADSQEINDEIEKLDKLKTEMKRTSLLLVPSAITSPQGKKLDLAWEGKEGHVRLNTIRDLTTDLLTATHGAPVANGKYASTFTVWPGTEEEYTVTLHITDCLLSKLTRKGKNDASPTQTVVFGYCGDPVLDRVLNSVAEEDGSLEVVSYVTAWKTWDPHTSVYMPLPRVGRHTLVPGAGQPVISHTWQWVDINNPLQKEGDSFSSTQTLDLGDGVSGPFTRRTWALKNSHCLETEIVEEVQGVSRTTTRMEYPDEVSGTTLAAKYRWATQPVKVTVTTEDLQTTTSTPAAQETLS